HGEDAVEAAAANGEASPGFLGERAGPGKWRQSLAARARRRLGNARRLDRDFQCALGRKRDRGRYSGRRNAIRDRLRYRYRCLFLPRETPPNKSASPTPIYKYPPALRLPGREFFSRPFLFY